MGRLASTVMVIGLAGSLLAFASVFMAWVEYGAPGDLASSAITGWDALTSGGWGDLEGVSAGKDCHFLPGCLLALGGVSAVMFVVGYLVRSPLMELVVDIIPAQFGLVIIIGICWFLDWMDTCNYSADVGVGVWMALAASVVVMMASVIGIGRIAMSFRRNGADSQGSRDSP